MNKNTKIKLCYVLPEYNENTDSHFYHLYEFLEELSKKIDIFLIIEKSTTRKVKIGSKVCVQRFRFVPFRFLESFFIILKARFLGYKVFYVHYAYIGAINAGIISRLFGGKSFYWNCAMNWLFRRKTFSALGLVLSLKLSHFLVTGNEEMKKGYIEHHDLKPEKIKVMPNWINLNRFKVREQIPKVKNTLLFVHWLSKRKGADMLVPIIKHLVSEFKLSIPDFKLLVIGNGPYKEKLEEEIKENKLNKFIDILGGMPQKEIAKHYAEADIFIMPSMEEGFPRVLLEAMASGVPYVASDVGGVREISPEIAQRFLVKSGDVEMFAHKIEALISDEKTYEDFKKEELEQVKKYSLEKAVDRFVKLLT